MADTPDRHARHRIRRHPERGSHERELAWRVLDAGQIAHVGWPSTAKPTWTASPS